MSEKLPTYFQKDFSAGMISSINESITPRNSVRLGLNVDFDVELGSAVTRPGTFIVGGQMVAGNSILGLHQHRGGSNKLFSVINDTDDLTSVIYDETGAVLVTGLTASKKMRFLTYGGETIMINGSNSPRSWNETTFVTTGGVFDL